MKRGTAFGLILLGVMGILTSAAATAEPTPDATQATSSETAPETAPPPVHGYRNIITLYGGDFRIGHDSQNVNLTGKEIVPQKTCLIWIFFCWYDGGGYVTSPLANHFDKRSYGVFSGGYERMFRDKWSVGGLFMQMGNSYSIPAVSPGAGEVTTRHFFVMGGRYFRDPDAVRPFIRVGLGLVVADFFGPLTPRGIGYGAGAIAGLRYQVDHLSLSAEVRAIGSNIPWHKGQGTGSVYGSLNMSGVGAFVGMGYAFK